MVQRELTRSVHRIVARLSVGVQYPRRVALTWLCAGLLGMSTCNKLPAQAPGESASPVAAAVMTSRALMFMRDLARLSPIPAASDPDREQAWPRSTIRVFRLPDGTIGSKSDREFSAKVTGHDSSGQLHTGILWAVDLYGGEIKVTVHSGGRRILGCIDGVLINAIIRNPPAPLSECISAETAMARAQLYLQIAGIDLTELSLRSAQFINGGTSASEASRKWDISWDRQWRGVVFEDQRVTVSLDASHGRLLSFGSAVAMPTPAVARIDVTPERASEIAGRQTAARQFPVDGPAHCEIRIVQPSNYWTSPRFPVALTEQKQYTRLAWIVRVPTIYPPVDSKCTSEVWVDTISGEVIGGDISTIMGRGAMPVYGGPIGISLRSARRLEARRLIRGKDGGYSAIGPAEALDPKADSLKFYGAVSKIRIVTPGNVASAFRPTHRLTAIHGDSRAELFDCDAKQGLIRNAAGDIASASSPLRAWLNSINSKPAPARNATAVAPVRNP